MSSSIPMDKYEIALLEQYPDLKVTTSANGHYIVTDKQMPRGKQRREGGNLYSLILRAIDERNRLKIKTLGEAEPITKREDILESNVIAFRKRGKVRVKIRDEQVTELKEGKTFLIKMAVYNNPDMNTNEITAHLKQNGMTGITRSTIATIRSEFLSSLRVLRDLGALKVEKLSKKR